MDMDAARFRVLLAEDDPVSREFLVEALRACGADVTACADGHAALDLALRGTWNLLVFDHHLPGLTGDAVLAALDAKAATARPAAIAITAAADDETATLLRAGFAEVLPKPMPIATLRAALQRHGCRTNTALDDDAALRACGSEATVMRLRGLLVEQELPAILAELDAHAGDPESLRPTLHRLRASCGFCGASALADASSALHNAIAAADAERLQAALSAFRDAIMETCAALQVKPHDRP